MTSDSARIDAESESEVERSFVVLASVPNVDGAERRREVEKTARQIYAGRIEEVSQAEWNAFLQRLSDETRRGRGPGIGAARPAPAATVSASVTAAAAAARGSSLTRGSGGSTRGASEAAASSSRGRGRGASDAGSSKPPLSPPQPGAGPSFVGRGRGRGRGRGGARGAARGARGAAAAAATSMTAASKFRNMLKKCTQGRCSFSTRDIKEFDRHMREEHPGAKPS